MQEVYYLKLHNYYKISIVSKQPEVSAAVFTVTSPQLLKPIVTADGIYLVLVEEIVQAKLNQKIHQGITLDLFSEWLKQQTRLIQVVNCLQITNNAA